MSGSLVPRQYLTPAQLRAVELPVDQHRVVSGGPGSGKTQVLLHRARFLADRYGVPSDRFRIFVYTRILKDYLRSASELLRIPEDCISTLDSWCITQHKELVGGSLPTKPRGGIDFTAVRSAVGRRLSGRRPVLDFAMVDEGQDLDDAAYAVLKAAAKHITVCMDHKQQIYSSGSSAGEVISALGLRQHNAILLSHYRSSPYVVRLAASFLDDPGERRLHIAQTTKPEGERSIPVLYKANDLEHERTNLGKVIRTRMGRGDRIAILFPRRRQVYGFATGLKSSGIDVEVCANDAVNFSTDSPKVMTYHSAKGLTFDSVLLPRLVPASFEGQSAERLTRLLFVAASRAVKWVYLSTVEGNELPILKNLDSLVAEGDLDVRTSADDIRALDEEEEDEESVLPY